MSEEVRELLAVLLLEADEVLTLWVRTHRIRNMIREGRVAEHDGDCTLKAYPCIRCEADRHLQAADIMLAGLDSAGFAIVTKLSPSEGDPS